MTSFARTLLAGARRTKVRVPMLLAAFGAVALLASLTLAAGAGAMVRNVGGVSVGLQSRDMSDIFDAGLLAGEGLEVSETPLPEQFANASGNPVMHESNVYAIYWDPTYHYHNDWKALIDTFLHNLAAASGADDVFAVDTQYTDTSNVPAGKQVSFRGAYTDTTAYPTAGCSDPEPLEKEERSHIGPITCLSDAQVRQQLESFISEHGLTTGMSTIFYILTPPGVTVCLGAGGASGHCSDFSASKAEKASQEFKSASYRSSFCSYHSDINPGGSERGGANTVLYAVIPWVAGGEGDGQLAESDENEAAFCQDGGFNPSSQPAEEREESKKLSAEEEKKLEEMNPKEKAEFLRAHELEGPHEQEPNQVACPSPDGYCDSGLADLEITQIGSEQQDIVTDPLLDGWKDPNGYEATDECRNFFAPVISGDAAANPETGAGSLFNQTLEGGNYYINDTFNLAAERLNYPGLFCLNGIALEPKFTAPVTVGSGEVVGFDGGESDITLDAGIDYSTSGAPQPNYATYTWNFGDGSPEVSGAAPGSPPCEAPWSSQCAESVFHTYQYAGSYVVTLTVKDVGGNVATVQKTITVTGQAPPSPSPQTGSSSSPQAGSTAQTSTGASSSSGAGASASLPAPLAEAAVVSSSLHGALSKGLLVRYRVSEQVAGHFEVLLRRKLAHELGISGPAASGLPPGSEQMVIVARALLVTTKGGNSTVHIKFSKGTAERLRRRKTVSLELRLIVHNAATVDPITAVVTSAVTLGSGRHGAH